MREQDLNGILLRNLRVTHQTDKSRVENSWIALLDDIVLSIKLDFSQELC